MFALPVEPAPAGVKLHMVGWDGTTYIDPTSDPRHLRLYCLVQMPNVREGVFSQTSYYSALRADDRKVVRTAITPAHLTSGRGVNANWVTAHGLTTLVRRHLLGNACGLRDDAAGARQGLERFFLAAGFVAAADAMCNITPSAALRLAAAPRPASCRRRAPPTKEEALEQEVARLKAENRQLKRERDDLQDSVLCAICMESDAPRSVVFSPCNHLVACAACAPKLKECSLCRAPVKKRIKIKNSS